MKRFLITCAFLSVPTLVCAQSARPTDSFQWDMTGPSLAVVQAYRYDVEMDGVVSTTPLTTTCTGTASPFTCKAPIPPITPSQHVVRVRAADVTIPSEVITGEWSDPLSFSMRATPNKPGPISIVRQ